MATVKDIQEDPYGEYIRKAKLVESGGNPNAKAKTSTASGLFQFTEGTWKELSKKHNLGYTLQDRFDPIKSEKAMRLFTQDNESVLSPILGRPLSDSERYLGHFLGVGGASNLFKANKKDPNMTVDQYMSPTVLSANKSIFYNKDGSVKTTGQIFNWASNKMNSTAIFANSVAPHMTTNVKDFEIPQISGNFASVPDVYIEPKEEEKSKDLEVLQQKDNEKSFLEELYTQREQIKQEEEAPVTPLPQTNLIDTFNQVSQFVDTPLAQEGGIPISSQGVYDYPMQEVIVPTKNGKITMKNVSYSIEGTDEYGNKQMMHPGGEYQFQGKTIHEKPQIIDKEKAFLQAMKQYKSKQ